MQTEGGDDRTGKRVAADSSSWRSVGFGEDGNGDVMALPGMPRSSATARHRGHAQTTSLHASSPSSPPPFSSAMPAPIHGAPPAPPVTSSAHSKSALFDRLSSFSSSSSTTQNAASNEENEPPISNFFMAAIKRSQANHCRNPPKAFHQHLQQNPCLNSSPSSSPSSSSSSSSTSLLFVKVELRALSLLILDDPRVSRVFPDVSSEAAMCKWSGSCGREGELQMIRFRNLERGK